MTFLFVKPRIGIAHEANPVMRALAGIGLWAVILAKGLLATGIVVAIGHLPRLRWLGLAVGIGVPLIGALANLRALP